MTGRRVPAFSGSDQKTLLARLREVDFALQETALYLDAYPDDREALDYYRGLLDARQGILGAYPKDRPLTIYDNDGETWNWVDSPWPWEFDAN